MEQKYYANAPLPVRDDLAECHARALKRLSSAGTWYTGAERLMIAAESRNAKKCLYCAEQKEALSPNALKGEHDSSNELSKPTIEVIHRIVTDTSRLTPSWLEKIYEQGVTDAEYVEIIGVVTTTISLDTFARTIGIEDLTLPLPVEGEPSRIRPASATNNMSWVPTVDVSKATPEELGLYDQVNKNNVRRALSLVTAEAAGFFNLVDHQYLDGAQIHNVEYEANARAISRAQIELLSSRVSALNQCYY